MAAAVVFGGCSCEDETVLIVRPPGEGITDTRARIAPCEDADGDGYGKGAGCLGPDCDDADPALGEQGERACYTGPAGTEGVGACAAGLERCEGGALLGCTAQILPADERCDGVDQDCDGQIDEGLTRSCYTGPAGTEGVAGCAAGTESCADGDWGECLAESLPADEVCDGLDNDCDGQADEQLLQACYTGPAGTEGVGRCAPGEQSCALGAWGVCQGQRLPADEVCDGLDDDCDGLVDEEVTRSCYQGPAGTAGVGLCRAGTAACEAGSWLACLGQTLPAPEVCDGQDNDCDGEIDEGLARACYTGPAGTEGIGSCVAGTQLCSAGAWGVCNGQRLPSVERCDAEDNDCDGQADESLARACYGGPAGTEGVGSCAGGTQSCAGGAWGACLDQTVPAPESCNGRDDDCDGTVDEALTRSCYDGAEGTQGRGLCTAGSQGCEAGAWGRCRGQTLPAAEACDALDNDCDGAIDEGLSRACYPGPAGTEGVGACAPGTQTCGLGEWGDCAGHTLPVAETCNAVDDDCDGALDEGLARSCYTGPLGTEGVGACVEGTQACAAGGWGACEGERLPALESCDGVDNDCDRGVDEGLAEACYEGPAGTEGVGVCHAGSSGCAGGSFGECRGQRLPAAEICNGLDDDCDGEIDEGLTHACYSGPAGTEGVGVCTGGLASCVAGSWEGCSGQVVPGVEGCDGVDNDCDGAVDEGLARLCYPGPEGTEGVGVCAPGVERCAAGSWGLCEGARVPSAERCDGLDNDCDGERDEALTSACYDGPAGTEGVGLCRGGLASCVAGAWQGCAGQVLPGYESCDALDNDCDGAVDDGLAQACYTGPAGTEAVGACQGGVQSCSLGAWGPCQGQVVPEAERCNGIDEDCDGRVDEELMQACYGGPTGTEGVGPCRGGSQTCVAGGWSACAGATLPDVERCDGLDNDCDGAIDETLLRLCYAGPEGTDGIGACRAGVETCSAGAWGACSGQVLPAVESCDALDNDCDGAIDEALVQACYGGPAGTEGVGACRGGTRTCALGDWGACVGVTLPAAESCDALDNDCDGAVDEALVKSCYSGPAGTFGVGTCSPGVSTCAAGAWGVCSGESLPALEVCDAADNDCDGTVDEDISRGCYDGPAATLGVGPCRGGTQTCASGGWSGCDAQVLPAPESCDAVDNDCDGSLDQGLDRSCYGGPAGTEGVGLCAGGVQSCTAGAWSGCVGERVPSAESCDGRDEDCDGAVDEGLVEACYSGPAGTAGQGICAEGSRLCSGGAWGECAGAVLPATEVCDDLDNDCNGQLDENVTVYTRDGSNQSVSPIYRPVDIVFVVDNSGSMTDEIQAVEANINGSFAAIMDGSSLDYRVIMLSKHGVAAYNQSICIRPPLGGNTSCSTSCPVNGPRFFQYSTEIGSHDSLYRIVHTYAAPDACGRAPDGWRQWLRPGAARVFIEITDDGPDSGDWQGLNTMTADGFEALLFALDPAAFGTAAGRDYVFHTIAGLQANSPATAPWLPGDPLLYYRCGSDVEQNGLEYQKLSQRTGGLRYPICQYANFDAVFEEVARGIIEGTEMSCDFQLSSVPGDSAMENTELVLVPSNGGAQVTLVHVADAAACTGGAFYTEGPVIRLCPDACLLWRDDPDAVIEVLFTCESKVQ